MFKGSMVALITPMKPDGSLDLAAFDMLLNWHVEQGTKGIVLLGTTGESPTINAEERELLIKRAVEILAGRIALIVGTGTNSTAASIALSQQAQSLGADACLVVGPYYNKPTQEGLYQHFKAVAESVKIPVIIYNIPGRTACDILPDTIIRLSKIENIVGVKEVSGKLDRVKTILKDVKDDFVLLSGEDPENLEFMKEGGHGVISVVANVAPALMSQMCHAMLDADIATAEALNEKLKPLCDNLFVETNPIPVKWAVSAMGLSDEGTRLPLTWLSDQYHEQVKAALSKTGLL